MLLDNVLDRNLTCDDDAPSLLVLGEQRSSVALNLFLVEIGHFLRHQVVIRFICIVEAVFYAISLLPSVLVGPTG